MAKSSKKIVQRLKIICIDGPWLDQDCIRYIDIPAQANLYDLHIAIQDAVQFDDEHQFYFYSALAEDSERTYIPDDIDPEFDDVDTDIYEDMLVFDYIKKSSSSQIFYVFKSELDDWVFKVSHTGEEYPENPKEFYPLVLDHLNIGPNPEQYGSGFDDFDDDPDSFKPTRTRYNSDEYNRDDDEIDDDDPYGQFFGRSENEDDYYNEDDDDDMY